MPIQSESYIYETLRSKGIDIEWRLAGEKVTFKLGSGRSITVKFASFHKNRKRWTWIFDYSKKITTVDFFVCIARYDKDIYSDAFVFPRDSVGRSLQMSIKQLKLGKYDYFRDNWALITDGEPKLKRKYHTKNTKKKKGAG